MFSGFPLEWVFRLRYIYRLPNIDLMKEIMDGMFPASRHSFIHRKYRISGAPADVLDSLSRHLTAHGMVKTETAGNGLSAFFRYPSIFFSSKRPLTCISKLFIVVSGAGGDTEVEVGVTFTKIRNYTMFILGFIWVGLPVLFAIFQRTVPNFSPFGVLVVPVGFLLHYSVRGKVFRTLKRLIESVEGSWDSPRK